MPQLFRGSRFCKTLKRKKLTVQLQATAVELLVQEMFLRAITWQN